VLSFKDVYNYMVVLENLLTYGYYASQSHLISEFWYPVEGDFSAHNPPNNALNRGYQAEGSLPI